jgi:hypothetical protein
MRNVKQDLFFAFVYNALGVPVAAGVLYPFFGLPLSPMRLRRVTLRGRKCAARRNSAPAGRSNELK